VAFPARKYELTHVTCDYCNSDEHEVVLRKRGAQFTDEFSIVRCRRCGFVFVNPRLSDQDIAALYDDEYYAGRGFDRTIAYDGADKDPDKRRDIVAMLTEAAGPLDGRRSLDVGCGNGLLVSELRRSGAQAYGLDSSASAIALCRKRGVPVFPYELSDPRLDAERFDIITAIEVIEHVTSPTRFLDRLRGLLAPGGVLFIGTGSWELVRRQPGTPYLMPEGHICYFTPRTLAKFFSKAGFAVDWRTLNRTWIGWRLMPGAAGSRLRQTTVRLTAAATHALMPSVGPFPLARLPRGPSH